MGKLLLWPLQQRFGIRVLDGTAPTIGTTVEYNYDPYGRQHTVNAIGSDGSVTQLHHYTYDGFNRVISHKKLRAGTASDYTTVQFAYDPMDRTTSRTENPGTTGEETTNLNYLGLSSQVLNEEIAGDITRSYNYSPWGERLSMVKNNTDGTSKTSYYGYNPHTDVETLFDENGDTRATYGYTAYGQMDEKAYTFEGQTDPDPNRPDPYNVYRYNSKRWDPHTRNYDMGFRNYSPGLNRFLTRDMYNGALANMRMSTDPFTMNRYAFAGGNPISMVELDGHIPAYIAENPEEGFQAWEKAFGESYSVTMAKAALKADASSSDIIKDGLKATANLHKNAIQIGEDYSSKGKGLYGYGASTIRDAAGIAASKYSDSVNFALNAWQAGDHIFTIAESAKDINQGYHLFKTGYDAGNGLISSIGIALKNSTKTISVAGKLAGGLGIAVSGGEAIYNFSNGNTSAGIANIGEGLISAAPMIAATGFGAPVAAVVAGIGVGVWAGATIASTDWGSVGKAIREFF